MPKGTPSIVLPGDIFGSLTVTSLIEKRGGQYYHGCLCSCGRGTIVRRSRLLSGTTKSCGCLRWKTSAIVNRTHGGTANPELAKVYSAWHSMKQRCTNVNNASAQYYSQRGISVCQAWLSFDAFLKDMGVPPANTSLGRIDNSKGYCKENCRWETAKEQANNKSNNRLIKFNGKEQSLALWARELGIAAHVILGRLNMGWAIERALTEPVRTWRNK